LIAIDGLAIGPTATVVITWVGGGSALAAPAAEKTAVAIEVIDAMAIRNMSTWLIVPQRDVCVIADPGGGERIFLPGAPVCGGWRSRCSRPAPPPVVC
jgi:hypothetical protein